MISFDSFVMEEGVPLYQQILLYVKRGIAGGTIQDGDELPSRRVLSGPAPAPKAVWCWKREPPGG